MTKNGIYICIHSKAKTPKDLKSEKFWLHCPKGVAWPTTQSGMRIWHGDVTWLLGDHVFRSWKGMRQWCRKIALEREMRTKGEMQIDLLWDWYSCTSNLYFVFSHSAFAHSAWENSQKFQITMTKLICFGWTNKHKRPMLVLPVPCPPEQHTGHVPLTMLHTPLRPKCLEPLIPNSPRAWWRHTH